MTRDIRPRRSCLSVPGSSSKMLAKAATLAADQVMLDLEDAVAPEQKAAARSMVVEALRTHDYTRKVVSLRINDVNTPWCYRDLVEVVEAAGERLETVVVPKVDGPDEVVFVDRLLRQIELQQGWEPGRIGLEAQIESAAGLQRVDDIGRASARLEALVLGPGDLSASLGLHHLTIGDLGDVAPYVMARVLVAARANGLLAIDGPYAGVSDTEGLERSSRRTAVLGFDGKWAIHPGQIETINRIYSPDPSAYRRAEAILAACEQAQSNGLGAARHDGQMIDEATRKMAEAVARRGRRLGLGS